MRDAIGNIRSWRGFKITETSNLLASRNKTLDDKCQANHPALYPCILVSLYPCILVSLYPCILVSLPKYPYQIESTLAFLRISLIYR